MKKYEQVIEYIKKSIQFGSLHIGDCLPSIRTMARTLDVSTVTVYEAYCRLEEMGVVIGEERRGFVITSVHADLQILENSSSHSPDNFGLKILHFHNSIEDYENILKLGCLFPSNIYFPHNDLSKNLARIVRSNPDTVNSYWGGTVHPGVVGSIEKMTAKYMYTILGIAVTASEIIMTNGTLAGLHCIIAAVSKPGDVIAVEAPGFPGTLGAIDYLSRNVMEIDALPPSGFDVDQFETLLKSGARPVCVIVSPNYQNPTGVQMPLDNRIRLLEIAQKYEVIVIENDALGALRFGKMVPTLKSIKPDQVIYVSSYTKTLAPGYRIGWIAGGQYQLSIARAQSLGPFTQMKANQEAVAEYIESGKVKSQINNLQNIYKENCSLMADAIEEYFPQGTTIFRPDGGQFLWVTMPEKISVNRIVQEARKHNILCTPGTLFSCSDRFENCLRFCFAQPINEEVINAIKIVAEIASNQNC